MNPDFTYVVTGFLAKNEQPIKSIPVIFMTLLSFLLYINGQNGLLFMYHFSSLIDRSKHFYELSVGNIRKKTNFIKLGREVKHEQTKIQLNFTCLKWCISELALADHVLFMQSSS